MSHWPGPEGSTTVQTWYVKLIWRQAPSPAYPDLATELTESLPIEASCYIDSERQWTEVLLIVQARDVRAAFDTALAATQQVSAVLDAAVDSVEVNSAQRQAGHIEPVIGQEAMDEVERWLAVLAEQAMRGKVVG